MAQPSNYSSIKDALEVFNECIKNGNEIKNLCAACKSATIKSHPVFKKLVAKIDEDTKAIEKLMLKVNKLKKSIDDKDYQKWKADLGDDINSLETESNETITKISHALASSKTRRVKKKFEENERILSSSDLTSIADLTARNFADVLLQTNRKIVECLKYANSLLPKYFEVSDISKSVSKSRKKLFIIGEDLSKNVTASKTFEHLGEVTIKNKETMPTLPPPNKTQVTEFRQNLNGYLIDGSEKTEVLLRLKEPLGTINLMEFSQNASGFDTSNLSATIEINGKVIEDVDIIEITLQEDPDSIKGPEVLAIVENHMTGNYDQVPVQLVPKTPDQQVHGKIIEIQPAAEHENVNDTKFDMSDSLFNSTFKFNTSGNLPNFATPSRKDRAKDKSFKSNYFTPIRGKQDRLRNISLVDKLSESFYDRPAGQEKSRVFDQIVEDAAEKVVAAIMNESSRLEDISEIDFADMSSFHSPNISRQHQEISNRSIQSPRQISNLADVSEIDFADLSDDFGPNVSVRSRNNTIDSMKSPRRLITQDSNLEDISEIEYANFSGFDYPNQSVAARSTSIRSPQMPLERSLRKTTPVKIQRQQAAEGVLIDIEQSPVRPQRRSIAFNDGNLMQFENSPRTAKTQNNAKIKEMLQTLTDVLDEDLSSRLERRQKVHDRSLPHSRPKSSNKMLNKSLPLRMPMTSTRIEFDRTVQVVPSRIHEDAPITMAMPVAERPIHELSPLRPHEASRINRALQSPRNLFGNEHLQIPAQTASQSFHEQSLTNSYNRNISLPLRLTPKKQYLPPLERSLMTAYQENQLANQTYGDDLQNVSDPYSASLRDLDDDSSDENLQDISNPFTDSMEDIYNDTQPRHLPIQTANEYLARFDNNENLDNISFEFMDDDERNLIN